MCSTATSGGTMPKITSGSLVALVIGAALVVTQLPAADLPPNVSADLQKRGCRIAPSFQKHRENVVRAELTGNAVEDWAVLCVSRGEVYVLVVSVRASASGRSPARS